MTAMNRYTLDGHEVFSSNLGLRAGMKPVLNFKRQLKYFPELVAIFYLRAHTLPLRYCCLLSSGNRSMA
jgi:hypothetical protein